MIRNIRLLVWAFILAAGMVAAQPAAGQANNPPVANAGPDQQVYVGDTVFLNGSWSDPDGDAIVAWAWGFAYKPAGSAAELSDPQAPNLSFNADAEGDFVLALRVYDGVDWSQPNSVIIHAAENQPPTAVITADVTSGCAPLTVHFDGSESSDPEGVPLAYFWTFGDGSLFSTELVVSHEYQSLGTYVVRLLVVDARYRNDYQALEDEAALSIEVVGDCPVASAGADQSVHPGTVVTLDGSGSYDLGGNYPLTYAWTITAKPDISSASLSDPAAVNPSFTADAMGDYVLELVVTNSLGSASAADTIHVSTFNTPPVADAGPDQALIALFLPVTLDGSQSYDDDGDALFYSWSLVSGPKGSTSTLVGDNTAAPTLVPDIQGEYVIELVVSDPWTASEADSVTLSFTNVAPVADAGGNQAVAVGDTVLLDGSASSDANFDPLSYGWSLVSKPEGSTAYIDTMSGGVQQSFVADLPGTYIVSLVVYDGFVSSEPNNVTITATTAQNSVIALLREAIRVINDEIDPAHLKNANLANALTNKIIATIEKVEQGEYVEALDKMENDVLGKMDGCATGMVPPDKNDWIQDCTEQAKVYPLIKQAIDLLRQL